VTDTFPDIEGALRTWLRTKASLTAIVGQRIFFGVPKGATESSFPLIIVQLIGMAVERSDAPLDVALVQFDVWGSLDASGNGVKSTATALANALRSELDAVRGRTALTASVDAFGIELAGMNWLPDQDNDRPRYVVTAEVTAIAH
jgi:hypothetical protein